MRQTPRDNPLTLMHGPSAPNDETRARDERAPSAPVDLALPVHRVRPLEGEALQALRGCYTLTGTAATQRGAALLIALLTVTLVATMAAAAMWQQWRSIEIEAAERARVQSAWLLVGALDWSRLILREDLRTGGADHLAEPWAIALQEARLSTFLAASGNEAAQDNSTDTRDAFLSGQIIDAQSRLNLRNLLDDGGKVSAPALRRVERLFTLLGLPAELARTLADALQRAYSRSAAAANPGAGGDGGGDGAGLMPQRLEDLVWLGLPASSVELLAPYATLLAQRTTLNINTASAEVLYASGASPDMAHAQSLVSARQSSHFPTLTDANQRLGLAEPLSANDFSTSSGFFEVHGRLRLDNNVVEERSLVQRDLSGRVQTLWRERGSVAGLDAALAEGR